MGVGGEFARLAHRVGEQRERPCGGLRRVDLAQRPGRRVARVGVEALTGGFLGGVERQEVFLRDEDFAADFDPLGSGLLETARDGFQRAEVGGDVLALAAVAAGGAVDEFPGLVGEIDGKAVDLGFRDERKRGIGREPEKAAGALVPFMEVGRVERVVEREHRHGVAQFGKAAGRGCADALARAVGADERREGGFNGVVAAS